MAELILKTLILDQFKGATHAECTFCEKTSVTGYNAAGKTTIADAWYWLFTDKDYSLKSNPEVHPDFMEQSEPSVTAVCAVQHNSDEDWQRVEFRKFQKDSRTKKQIEAGAPVRISNQYEINSVPKSQKDFMAYLAELGIDMDNFLLLSHPEIFTGQKSADCRKILFGMVSDITDKEIADSLTGCGELSKLLESYKVDEVMAMTKRSLKEASENLKVIPEQIIGMERSKVDIDVSEFESQRDTLKAEISVLESKIMETRVPSVGDLNQKLVALEREQKALTAEANSERVAKLTEANAVIGDMKQKLRGMVDEKDRLLIMIDESMGNKAESEKRYQELADEFQKVKVTEFDATAQKCPYCGQDLPVHEIDKLAKQFEQDKATKMDKINHEAADVKKKKKMLEAQIPELQKQLAEKKEEVNVLSAEIEKRTEERVKWEKPIDASGTEESRKILEEITKVHHQMNRRDELQAQMDKILTEKRDREFAVRELEDRIAETKVNDRIDKQIAEAKAKQKQYAQAEADAQRILDQLAEVSMKKNQMLTDQVNSHFEIVKFSLFEQQKNGEYKDCCVPLIRNDNGEYMKFGESANTALEVRGKLDIISGLQKFYGQQMPVWVDGWECMDTDNSNSIHMDTQLITLAVADTPLTIRSDDVG